MTGAFVPAVFAIPRERMFEPLLVADPSFQPAWERFCDEWRDEEVELPNYLALCDLARHLIGKLAAGETEAFPAVFDVVERWHVEGDPYVQEAATIGLLEDLQNEALHHTTRPGEFERWLRPVSRKFWARVAQYWADGTPIRSS
ncbi:MAG: hypothetical protein ABI810_11840 [Sphingomonas bacterium]